MSGHGHVTPNEDGSKARCGGPAMCKECAMEYARLHYTKEPPSQSSHLGLESVQLNSESEEDRPPVAVSYHFLVHSPEVQDVIKAAQAVVKGRTYHEHSRVDSVDIIVALWEVYQEVESRIARRKTALNVVQQAITHAKRERLSPSYVPPGGVQYVTLPAWIVEELHG